MKKFSIENKLWRKKVFQIPSLKFGFETRKKILDMYFDNETLSNDVGKTKFNLARMKSYTYTLFVHIFRWIFPITSWMF